MNPQAAIPCRQLGMVAPARAARVGEHEDALDVIHERRGLGEVGRAGTGFDQQPIALADDAARAAGHFGDHVGTEALDDLVQRARHRRQRGELLDQAVAARDGLPALDRLAVAIDRPGTEVALRVGEGLVELDREGMGEIVEHIFARGDVDLDVAPLLGRDLGEPALHQRLAGRDDLDDGGVAGVEIALDRADQRRRLHRGQEVAEEALLGAFEGGSRGGFCLAVQRAGLAGDVGGPHRGVEVVMDDAERAGIGVVDANLLGRELVLDEFVLDALVGQRARRVETERLEVARQHLHGRDAALLDRLDELGAGGEREIVAAPQSQPLGVGEIVHRRGAGRRDIDHAGIRQGVLEPQARAPLLRGRLVTALALAANRVLHGVALVEDDHSVEVGAQPFDDLPDARKLFAALVGAQRSVGGK